MAYDFVDNRINAFITCKGFGILSALVHIRKVTENYAL